MTKEQATSIARSILNEKHVKTMEEHDRTRLAPVLYEIKMQGTSIHKLQAINGTLGPRFEAEIIANQSDPTNYAFFIDLVPNANWEHPCEYIFVHDSGKVTTIPSVAPPSMKNGAKKIAIQS